MENYDEWRRLFRNYIDADTSPPTRIPEEYKSSDHQIKLISELCSAHISYDDSSKIITTILMAAFNFIHNQRFSYEDYISNNNYIRSRV